MNGNATSGMVLAFMAYASFSISDAFSKLLAGSLDPFEVAFSGGAFGFLILPFVRLKHESYIDVVRTARPGMWLVRACAVFLATASSVEAFMLLPMPEALSLMFLMPFFVTLLSVTFLRERVNVWAWISVGIGFLGVMIVLRPGFRALNFGHLCALVAAMSNAVGVIAYRQAGHNSPRLSLFGSSLIGPLVGNGVLMMPHVSWPVGVDWVFLFGYGLLAALGQLLLMMATQSAPANRVALPQYSQMIWGVALSYTLFHQPLDVWEFVGVFCVTMSGLVNWIRQKIKFRHLAIHGTALARMGNRKV